MKFRELRAEEIECRVAQVGEKNVSVLLYKDARCDMNILDETVGAENWMRDHQLVNGNLFCTVSIWDEKKALWIAKQDVGVESYTEKEKGQASDSFKRACFNWGIGRELYSAPDVRIQKDKLYLFKGKNGKENVGTKMIVSGIRMRNRRITYLKISDAKNKAVLYEWEKVSLDELKELIFKTGTDIEKLLSSYKVSNLEALSDDQIKNACTVLRIKLQRVSEDE